MATETEPDRGLDLSGLFGEILGTLRLLTIGIKELVVQTAGQGTFFSYAGGGAEIPLQKNVDGVVRFIHNAGAQPSNVQLLDDKESYLFGSAAAPIVMPAGGYALVYIPFKFGLRANCTAGPIYFGGQIKPQ